MRRPRPEFPPASTKERFQRLGGVLTYGVRALRLVWSTHRGLTVLLGVSTVASGLFPGALAWASQRLIDSVVAAIDAREAGTSSTSPILFLVFLQGLLMVLQHGFQRLHQLGTALLRPRLTHRIQLSILEKASTLELAQFEDSTFYDKLTRARTQAPQRPLSLVNQTFSLIQYAVMLASFAVLLSQISYWIVVILILAAVPSFAVEAKFSDDIFRLYKRRSSEYRRQGYLETVMAREDFVKEVKLFDLFSVLLGRYRQRFENLYKESRALAIRRALWEFGVGLLRPVALYASYAWVVLKTVSGALSLGQMTMAFMLFRQGQNAIRNSLSAISTMYEDNLYLSTLDEYLDQEVPARWGHAVRGSRPGDGLRLEGVAFTYPGQETAALEGIDLHLPAGESLAIVGPNGSGKTTLIKLLAGLYEPTRGVIRLDGLDLHEWSEKALRTRLSIIFQDFARYQWTAGENLGAGDPQSAFEDSDRWAQAARDGLADNFIEELPDQYQTQLGKWFEDGRELSGGQWQKVALSRAMIRQEADILILDEPTSAIDPDSEARVFDMVDALRGRKSLLLISHRLSTVRLADHIVVLDHGRIVERGTHQELLDHGTHYARMFGRQAQGFR